MNTKYHFKGIPVNEVRTKKNGTIEGHVVTEHTDFWASVTPMNTAEAAPDQVAQHTPTPWECSNGLVWSKQNGAICDPLCEVGNSRTQSEAMANAAFIVSACNCHEEMLEALKRLLRLWQETIGNDPDYMDMAGFARAAIAKAEGKL